MFHILQKRLLQAAVGSQLRAKRSYSIGVVGAPFWNGQATPGTEKGPDALRGAGLLNKLNGIQENVVDFGNLNFSGQPVAIPSSTTKLVNKNEFILARMCSQLSQFVATSLDEEYVSLILGGDHSIAVGSVLGTCAAKRFQDQEISLIWIDAHADANMENTSKSGHYHGMPVSFLLKDLSTPRRHLFQNLPQPRLKGQNVVYVGLRDVELQELHILQQMGIHYFAMDQIDKLGIHEVMSRALDLADPTGKNALHVSFDVDSVEDSSIVSTGTPVLSGLTVREAMCIGEVIEATGRMVALDVVEFNPQIGTHEQVARSAKYIIDIVLSFFGKSRAGYFHRRHESL